MNTSIRIISLSFSFFLTTGLLAQAPQTPPSRPTPSTFLDQLKDNDADNSGTLSKQEAASIRMLSPSLFAAVDSDGDGEISAPEALRADRIEQYTGEPATLQFEGKEWISTHAIGAKVVAFQGKQALHLVGREQNLVYLPVDDFSNGTIEVDLAGPIFTGIVFRVRESGKRAEKVYFRPQNAGTERHLNTVQYAVLGREDGHWSALRRDFPGKYEAGADIQQNEWFHVRMVIRNSSIKVYVNDGTEPVLTVDPMLDGISTGAVGLWGWDSYFANFKYVKE